VQAVQPWRLDNIYTKLFLGNTKFTMNEQAPDHDMARLMFLRTRVLGGVASVKETEEFDLLVRKIVDEEVIEDEQVRKDEEE